MKSLRFGPTWLAALLGFAALAAPLSAAADPNTLWNIVHGKCVPDERAKGDPAPCLAVHLKSGYAVLKDNSGATQVLVIPTAKVTGIEDPKVLAAAAPNYFAFAWTARSFVDGFAKQTLPRDELTLAVNSIDGRSQNQLHIHVDCITRRGADRAGRGPREHRQDLGADRRRHRGPSLPGDEPDRR